MKNKVVFIVGPTGVGKTALAVKLAQKYNGALVSADSVQVYRGADIISGKDHPKDTSIYLLDVVEPPSSFSVSNFQELGTSAIEKIQKQNKLPIVVGGTGLYVKSLIGGIETNKIQPDLKLRKQLEGLEVFELQKRLKELNKEKFASMNASDVNNKRRLIRAIEISSSQLLTTTYKLQTRFDSLAIGLYCDREVLKKRIDERVDERLKKGALKEAEGLFHSYKNLSKQVKDANGYKQLFQYLQKKITLDEAIYRWKISEYRHAKNQMTWFRKYGNVEWYDIEKANFKKQIEKRVEQFLSP